MYIQGLELSCMAIKYNLLTICCRQPREITTNLVTLVLVGITKQTNKELLVIDTRQKMLIIFQSNIKLCFCQKHLT